MLPSEAEALAFYDAKIRRQGEMNFASEVYMCKEQPGWFVDLIVLVSFFFFFLYISLWSFILSRKECDVDVSLKDEDEWKGIQ